MLLTGLSVVDAAERELVSVFADSGECLVPSVLRRDRFAGAGTFLISLFNEGNYAAISIELIFVANFEFQTYP